MDDNPLSASIQSAMKAIGTLMAQVMIVTTQVQNLATDAGQNATAITTTSATAMTPCQLQVEDVINYSDKVGLSQWKQQFNMKAS